MPNKMNIINFIQPGSYVIGTLDAGTTLMYTDREGIEFDTGDESFASAVLPNNVYSGIGRTYRIVRNMSATAVTGGQLVIPSQVSGFTAKRTIGPQTTAGDFSYVVDPDLVTCPQYGLYLIVAHGPTQVNNAAGANDEGDIVVSTTTSGDGATIASGSVTARQASNKIGRCIAATAATTAGKMDVLVTRN